MAGAMTYTLATTIPTAGISGAIFNALHNPSTSTAVTVDVTPVRNAVGATFAVAIAAGDTLDLKVKYAKPSATIVGFS